MRTRTRFERVLVLGFLVALTLAVLVPASPIFQKLPSWDSGVFLYTGWRVTLGELPYRDVWDHKPPLIFAINALGLVLANGSRWGVWAIEFVFMLAAGLLGFSLIRRAFGLLPAVYASAAWIVNAFVTMDGGNYTTEYALPLQFALLWLVATSPVGPFTARRAFVLGILSALLFWFKQNDIGIPVAIVLWLALEFFRDNRRAALVSFFALAVGALLLSALVILPFLWNGALTQFWEAAFLYNFDYIDRTWLERVLTLRIVPVTLPALGLTTFAFVGWLIAVLSFLNGLRRKGSVWAIWRETLERLWGERSQDAARTLPGSQVVRLMTLVLIALPLECFFVILAGNTFDHYYLALLPVFAVLAAFLFQLFIAALERAELSQWAQVAFVIALIGILTVFSAEYVKPIFYRIVMRDQSVLIDYLVRNTELRDSVLVWGGEARINFESKRVSPTRFVYLSPLRPNAPRGSAYTREMINDLRADPPRVMVDMADSSRRVLEFSVADPEFVQAGRALLSQYEIREKNDDWTVYEYRAR